ncbi:MAG: hypothetical protein FD144_4236 [Rhodospirillaceae bacterium]|nr:MAG: hypothetical protein FD144_4236 [Rhodospirillaceae bacterium]
MSNAKSIREGFKSARTTVPGLRLRKPAKSPERSVEAPIAASAPIQGPPPGSATKAPAAPPPGRRAPPAVAPRPPKEPCRVNAANPSVCLPAGERFRLTIRGCEVKPARQRPVVTVRAMGKQYALIRWEVMCDGQTELPSSSVQVCIDLVDRRADVEVIVERRAANARPRQAPKCWRTLRTPRPTTRGYRPPKAAIAKPRPRISPKV